MKAINLRTDYLINPMPLDNKIPRFYWNCVDGIKQTAYQIVAHSNGNTIWDSGKVLSDQMTHILYNGKPLESRQRVDWSVCLWDEENQVGEWADAWFELGLTEATDWKAKWIAGDYKPKKNTRYPVDCFSKKFKLSQKIRQARLYITACGLYEAKLNGKIVGDFCLAPGYTDYRRRIQYQVYDISNLLSTQNQFEIWLADGWFRGSIGCFGPTNVFGRQTKLLSQIEIIYEDNSTQMIVSDDSFSWSNDGPIRFADMEDGEIYDASMSPSYNKKAIITDYNVVPTASNNVKPTKHECFTPKLIIAPSGKKILDFGQNIAGFVRFQLKGNQGQSLKMRFGEILDTDGEFTQKNILQYKPEKEFGKLKEFIIMTGNVNKLKEKIVPTPKQELTFRCSGNVDEYQMRFAIFGFQFAEIETDIDINPEDFRSIAVYSDMTRAGEFMCSNPKMNRFAENTVWSLKSNFLDVPTDCPTRERLGWFGDSQIFFHTATYIMDVASFFRKWMKDIKDAQPKSGRTPAVIPYAGFEALYNGTGSAVGFGDTVVLIPYRYWKLYGDDAFLKEFYDVMRNYALFMIKNAGAKSKKAYPGNSYTKYIYEKGVHLGEWHEPLQFTQFSPKELYTEEATAYLHYTMTLMTEIAHELNKTEDEVLFNEYAEGAKKAYATLFFSEGTIDTDRQAKLVRPIALGLAEGEVKAKLQQRLVKAVENNHYRVGTGFLSTAFLLPTLTEAGRSDVAYRMFENEEAPSWLSEVNAGATTVWEDWEGELSHNHYAPGSVCEWIYSYVAGIRVAGRNHFEIKPIPGGSLTYASASHASLYGTVTSSWILEENRCTMKITIPSNTTAVITLPNGESYSVESGTHTYEITTK